MCIYIYTYVCMYIYIYIYYGRLTTIMRGGDFWQSPNRVIVC